MSNFRRIEFFRRGGFEEATRMLEERGTVRTNEYYIFRLQDLDSELCKRVMEIEYFGFKLDMEEKWRALRHSSEYESADHIIFHIDKKRLSESSFYLIRNSLKREFANEGSFNVDDAPTKYKSGSEYRNDLFFIKYDKSIIKQFSLKPRNIDIFTYNDDKKVKLNCINTEGKIDYINSDCINGVEKSDLNHRNKYEKFLQVAEKTQRAYLTETDTFAGGLLRECLLLNTLSILTDVVNELPTNKIVTVDIS